MKLIGVLMTLCLGLTGCATTQYELKAPCTPYKCGRIAVNGWDKG